MNFFRVRITDKKYTSYPNHYIFSVKSLKVIGNGIMKKSYVLKSVIVWSMEVFKKSIFKILVCLFVCLFSEFIVPLEKFSLIRRRRHLPGKGCIGLTYGRLSWSLSSQGSLTCYTYYDMGHPFIMVIAVTLTPIAKCLAVELSLPDFINKICSGQDSSTQPFAYGTKVITHFATIT